MTTPTLSSGREAPSSMPADYLDARVELEYQKTAGLFTRDHIRFHLTNRPPRILVTIEDLARLAKSAFGCQCIKYCSPAKYQEVIPNSGDLFDLRRTVAALDEAKSNGSPFDLVLIPLFPTLEVALEVRLTLKSLYPDLGVLVFDQPSRLHLVGPAVMEAYHALVGDVRASGIHVLLTSECSPLDVEPGTPGRYPSEKIIEGALGPAGIAGLALKPGEECIDTAYCSRS